MTRFVLACLAALLAASSAGAAPRRPVAPAPAQTDAAARPAGGTPVAMAVPRRFSALDRAARALSREDLAAAGARGERPLLLVGTAGLGPESERQALFVQLQSARACGSSGCGTTVWLWEKMGRYRKVLDGSDGPLRVGPGRTRGMLDLQSDHDSFVWDGQQYRSLHPAPDVDLRPRR